MVKQLLKTMLLLCALVAGSGSAWATPTEYTFSEIPSGWSTSGGNMTISGISWTYASSTYIGVNSSKIQVGSKNNPQTSAWTIQTPVSSFGKGKAISAVSITAYTTATTATYDISVGGLSVKSGSLNTSSETYSATGLNVTSGDIVITMTGSSSSKAMYLIDISVTYDDASTDPIIGASNVEIDAEATSGEFGYTISNPVENTSLTASVTAGNDWLSDATVNTTTGKVTFTTTQNERYDESRQGTIHLVYGDNLATKDVTITQAAAVHKYTVTIETPSNGTLVVKNGETTIMTGDKIADGATLTITATPADGYRLKNWQALDGSTHTYTSGFSYTINAKDVTIKANFEVIPEHKATFYVNGVKNSEVDVKEGADIVFPVVSSLAGLKLLGWTTSAIEGTQTTKPATLVTKATMSTADITYYAVFGDELSASFDAADVTGTPQDGSSLKWTHTATGIYITLSAGQRYTSGTPNTFTVTKGTSNYLMVTAPNDCILENIIVTISGSSYKINTVQSGASLSTSSTTQTITFTSDMNSVKCFATKDNQIRATKIEVTAIAYCTTIPTATISLAAACTDGSKYYGTYSNSRAFLVPSDLVVSEISVIDGALYIEDYATDDIVPANTGVMVSSTTSGDHTVLLGAGGTSKLNDGNMLKPAVSGIEADDMDAENTKFYRLTMHNGTDIGFWWGAADGAAFDIAANKAYLAVPTSALASTRQGFSLFGEGEVNGIQNAHFTMPNGDSTVYNLNGQRVEKAKKGLYIKNGKKVVVK